MENIVYRTSEMLDRYIKYRICFVYAMIVGWLAALQVVVSISELTTAHLAECLTFVDLVSFLTGKD